MEKWVRSLRPKLETLNLKKDAVTIVMGNEACDLDSGVSALVLAYHRHILHPLANIFPLFNIHSKDYVLKTELVHSLEKYNISEKDLLFKDTLDLHALGNLSLILVDHNVLTPDMSGLDTFVCEVYDHHVLERKECPDTKLVVEMVGSCCSLVTQTIRSENKEFLEKDSLDLLLTTILLDTVALKPEAKKVTDKDVEMVDWLESMIGPVDRAAKFEEVSSAKARFEHLSPYQLLRRDLKCIITDKTKVGLSSVPLLAKNYLRLEGVKEALDKFGEEESLEVVLVLGYSVDKGSVSRDLFIYDLGTCGLGEAVASTLEDLNLDLTREEGTEFGVLYAQGNVAGSRKQILPAVKQLVLGM